MTKLELQAQPRIITGRKVKTLRLKNILPANIFGKKIKSSAIQVSQKDFTALYKQAGETNIIYLNLEKEKQARPVLVTNLQKHPVTDLPLHVDFHQVDLTEKVTVSVPLEIVGTSLAVKEKGAVLLTLLDEIKIEALPQDLPDKFTLDISALNEFGDSLLVKDLKVDKAKVTLLVEEDEPVIIAQQPKEEEEPAPVAAEAAPVSEEAGEALPPTETETDSSEKKDTK